jgi:uncharacterized membrane protein
MKERARTVLRTLLGIGLAVQGLNHFADEAFFLRMMPPYLPAHLLLVRLSGVAEIALGLAVFLTPLRRAAGFGILALLVAVFPANLQMALHPAQWPEFAPALLWARLPLQLLLGAWAYWVCLARTRGS